MPYLIDSELNKFNILESDEEFIYLEPVELHKTSNLELGSVYALSTLYLDCATENDFQFVGTLNQSLSDWKLSMRGSEIPKF